MSGGHKVNAKKTTSVWLSFAAALVLLLSTAGVAYAQGGTITGTISSPGGYPLPAGTVAKLFQPGGWDVFGQAQVDVHTGAFSLGPVPNGLYVLKAVPPAGSGYTQSEPVPVSVFNAPVNVGVVALTDPEIHGTVTAPDGFTPVSATVKVYAGSALLVQQVDAPSGEFLVGGLPAGSYSLRAFPATDDPYWQSLLEPVTVNGHTQALTLTLAAAELYGVAEDPLGNPVSGATVHATHVGGHLQHHDLTSASGYYAIGGLLSGTYVLTARPPWYLGALLAPEPVTVTLPGATPPYTLTFRTPPKVVTGTVKTNTGIGISHAQVIAHRLDKSGQVETLSGAAGGYRLDLSDGLWALTVRPISTTTPSDWVYPNPPQLVHFQHTVRPEHKQVDFTVLTADAHVSGTVALPGSGTLQLPFTVTVSLHNDEGIGARAVVSDSGAFDIAVPHGGYKVWVTPDDPGYMGPVVDPIRVPINGTYDLGTLTLLERDAFITGIVADEGGAGVASVPIAAWRPGVPGGARAVTGPDGQYVLSVVAGDWHVQPSPGPDQPYIYPGPGTRLSISSTQTISDVDFTLIGADAVIEGLLVDESGSPAADAEGWASATQVLSPTLHNGAPIQAGAFSIHVPGGTYRVAALLPAGSPYMSAGERGVTVSAGETASVTLTVKTKDAHIVGALWDPRNQDVVEGMNAGVAAWAGGNWVRTSVDAGNGAYRMDVASGLWHLGYHVDPGSNYVGLMHHKNVPVQSSQTVTIPLPVAERDGAIAGIVLGPDGAPLAGAKVIADGIGAVVDHVWLSRESDQDGRFVLPVPHGQYHLGATVGVTDSIQPALRRVSVPEGGVSGGHVLQFRWPDTVISGGVTVSNTTGVTGTVFVWAWSEDDAFVKTRVPVVNSVGAYSLDVISNTTWHVGAVYETPSQYWLARETVVLGTGGATRDLVLTGPHPKPAPVAVTFDALQPQRIELADGTHIYIPAGAMPVTGQVTLHIVPIATLPYQRHANVYRYGYAFTAVDAEGEPITEHFNQEVVIGFAYDDRELWASGINESFLKPAYFSTTTDRWTLPESYVVDTGANRVVMQIDHFTDFALTSEPGFWVYLPLVLR